ncbi:CaiB/BaiF CoA transferase family protein [Leifsonia naganoensis]|uniref:Crotonobetainyl-CoA:carnitine CoA-transferase CaiB-like acyl-CoA transferase n=1 Tax=Leifsonia naganoensis TaxID=150025 RepID=A0A853DK05_9MICO|nr:CoA transferase [Leifsonia naganoensis]NYK09562.1 crotonobetainyl-CoA:carnitine CoA-transferase CaiB-like acyl-CoA transferase [Leifsonia naganoensis]
MNITTDGALAGLRVLDATQMLAGPLAATRLGDLGADVIKIEGPAGEFNRTHGFEDIRIRGEMSTFLAVNRNKRSFCVDLKSPAGLEAFLELAATADVVLQNFRHGTADRLGIGYDALAAINPGIVYCSISGYGPTGPYRDRPGQDLIIQGYSGSMFSVGRNDDLPLPGALWAADTMTGYQAVIGILAALQHRDRTGRGQHVEVDMLSVVLDTQLQEYVTYLNSGRQPERTAEWSAHSFIPAPYGVYRTSDGWLALAMTELPRLGRVIGDEWLQSLTAYNDGATHKDEVYARIRNAFTDRTTDEWIAACDVQGVWAGPVLDYAGVAADPHVRETGMFVDQPHADGGTIRTARVPIRLSETAPTIRTGAPELGADTRSILEGLGFGADRIDELERAGAVRQATERVAAGSVA